MHDATSFSKTRPLAAQVSRLTIVRSRLRDRVNFDDEDFAHLLELAQRAYILLVTPRRDWPLRSKAYPGFSDIPFSAYPERVE